MLITAHWAVDTLNMHLKSIQKYRKALKVSRNLQKFTGICKKCLLNPELFWHCINLNNCHCTAVSSILYYFPKECQWRVERVHKGSQISVCFLCGCPLPWPHSVAWAASELLGKVFHNIIGELSLAATIYLLWLYQRNDMVFKGILGPTSGLWIMFVSRTKAHLLGSQIRRN